LDNDKTKERLLTEMKETDPNEATNMLEISRYTLASKKNLIVIVSKEEFHQKRIFCLKN
jgi:hypothetical protein